MKKLTVFLSILFLALPFCVFAQDAPQGNGQLDEHFEEELQEEAVQKKAFLIQDRSFELGLANVSVNFANNFLSIEEVFQDVIHIDFDKLSDGFMFNLGLNVSPFYFTYKSKKGWGFGLSVDTEAVGILGLSGKMLSFAQAVKENSDVSGALYASATVKSFFDVQKFKVKVNPSLFYTLAYITPSPSSKSGLAYTLDYLPDGTVMRIDYDIRLYTGFPLDSDNSGLTAKPGMDFSVGVEYPLAKEIGLTGALPFLDFDVSLDLINIPFISSKISDYTQIKGRIGGDKPITFFGDDGEDFFSSFDASNSTETGKNEIAVYRPFKMIVKADWRPLFGSKLLTVTPLIGFCHNELYLNPVSLEIGVNAGLNLANFFLLKIGFNYSDRLFVNSLNLAFNLRAFELDIGADLRSQDAAKSWTGAGFGVNFGLKFGW